MSQKAITIYTPAGSEAHITAADDAFIHDALLGGRSGAIGGLSCSAVGANTVRLSGGGASNKGYILYIPQGESHDLAIDNGTEGVSRIDTVVARFTKGGLNTADSHVFAVVKGTNALSPVAPALTTSSLSSAGAVNEVALFHVRLSGTSITSVTAAGSDAAVPASAKKLASARTISLSGAVGGSVSFDGSHNVTISTSLPLLEPLCTYELSMTSSQTDAVQLVKNYWSSLPDGKIFMILVRGGNYGANSLFIGDKTSGSFGSMLRMSYALTSPTVHYLRGGTWSSSTISVS